MKAGEVFGIESARGAAFLAALVLFERRRITGAATRQLSIDRRNVTERTDDRSSTTPNGREQGPAASGIRVEPMRARERPKQPGGARSDNERLTLRTPGHIFELKAGAQCGGSGWFVNYLGNGARGCLSPPSGPRFNLLWSWNSFFAGEKGFFHDA